MSLVRITTFFCLFLIKGWSSSCVLTDLAQTVSSITECDAASLRYTTPLLSGLAKSPSSDKRYLAIDIDYPIALDEVTSVATQKEIRFTFWRAEKSLIEIEPTDLLFLSQHYSYQELSDLLSCFSKRVRRYICLPKPQGPWHNRDDDNYFWHADLGEVYPSSKYDRAQGALRLPVALFLHEHPEWKISEILPENSHWTLLERIAPTHLLEEDLSSDVEEALKHRIVLCTGPAENRDALLAKSIETDSQLIPFKKVFIATHDPSILSAQISGYCPVWALFTSEKTPFDAHQANAMNTIRSALLSVASDPDVADDDIILFKHETLLINDMNLVKRAIHQLLQGHNAIVREFPVPRAICSNVFYVKASAVRRWIPQVPVATQFCLPWRYDMCELYLGRHFFNPMTNVYRIRYPQGRNSSLCTELGFHHIVSKGHLGFMPWDKANYNTLLK